MWFGVPKGWLHKTTHSTMYRNASAYPHAHKQHKHNTNIQSALAPKKNKHVHIHTPAPTIRTRTFRRNTCEWSCRRVLWIPGHQRSGKDNDTQNDHWRCDTNGRSYCIHFKHKKDDRSCNSRLTYTSACAYTPICRLLCMRTCTRIFVHAPINIAHFPRTSCTRSRGSARAHICRHGCFGWIRYSHSSTVVETIFVSQQWVGSEWVIKYEWVLINGMKRGLERPNKKKS